MQNRTELVGMPFSEKLRQALRENLRPMGYIGTGLLSAMLSGSYIVGNISPFGVAFVASVSMGNVLPAVLGAILGYFFSPVMSTNMQYIMAVVIIGSLKWFAGTSSLCKGKLFSPPIVASGAMLGSAAAVVAVSGVNLYSVMLAAAQTMLCGGTAYFFARTWSILDKKISTADKSDVVCMFVSFGIVVTALSHLTLLGVSIGRVLAVLTVLVFAYSGGESVGALVGVCAGTTAMLMGKSYGFLMGSYALGGLLAGVFATGGRVAAAIAFIITATIAGVTSPTAQAMQFSMYENLIAAAIFLVLPQNIIGLAKVRSKSAQSSEPQRNILLKKVCRIADGLRDIGVTTRQVSKKLENMNSAANVDIHANLAATVCKKCPRNYRCWQVDYNTTMDIINRCITAMKAEGSITAQQLPQFFSQECRNPEGFAAALSAQYGRYINGLAAKRKIAGVRDVVTDQFEGMALLMEELAGQWDSIRDRIPRLEERVETYLTTAGLEPQCVYCYMDQYGRLTVEGQINTLKLPRLDKSGAVSDISELVEREMDMPDIYTVGDGTVLTFMERAGFSLEVGAFQIVEEGSKITGDYYRTFADGRGGTVIALSDGMGSGGNAAVDSAMTCELLEKLIKSGAGYDAALKLVNSALLVKAGEETLATLDVISVDMYTGRAEIYKAGAAPTFLLRSGKAGYVQSTSLPAGILKGIAFEKSSVGMFGGDRIVVVSDGVTDTGTDWLQSQLLAGAKQSPQEFAESLAATAKLRHVQGRDDDITVIVADIKREL